MFAIVAALLGAFVASYVAHRLAVQRENERTREDRIRDRDRDRREKQRESDRERRELLGLLRLVHVEVVNNLELLKVMGADFAVLSDGFEIGGVKQNPIKRNQDRFQAPKLSTQAWEQSRVRIAALLEDEEKLKFLIGGYAALSALKDRLLHPETDPLGESDHQDAVKKVISHQWLSFDVCQKETGMFWAWNKGMLVSKPAKDMAEAEDTIEQ